MVKECIVLLLSGASIPLAFFPEALRKIVQYLPFRCIYDTPLSVLLQKNGYTWGTGLLSSLLLQLGWCIALGLVGAAFWSISLKKITVNGG
jgi:ABC-2 type transport system permease protein